LRETVLLRQPLHLIAELTTELGVVRGDQSAPEEWQVGRRQCVDGTADDVGDDDLVGAVHRCLVGRPGDGPASGRQREERRVAGEVRDRRRSRLREAAGIPLCEPAAREAKSENLLPVHPRKLPVDGATGLKTTEGPASRAFLPDLLSCARS